MLGKHARFLVALGLGGLTWLVAAQRFDDSAFAALLAANCFFVAYLALTLILSLRISAADLRRHAGADDEGAALILLVALVAVSISLAALFMVINRTQQSPFEAVFALASVPLGWTVIQVLVAFRYAHLYFAANPNAGLEFPGATPPDIWDFYYFSFTIGMTAQVSDVQITSAPLRRIVLVHGVGSFFFNTVILALAVNAGLQLGH